ncbi:IS1595 family transposase [Sandarakinorhabdus sp.]|uniref:IS1595 family transposase n=1 Tax=Sandarakinorhabdus sp. TaxID=1916663 RepID=UPI00286E5C8F|nr:IS1595 family transposase [Sandarakinorhabdus sp.]
MTNLTNPIYNNEDAARAHFEGIRWPDGRVCPHCGTIGNSTLMQGKTTRPGLYKCKDCRKPFTATMGTIYERSHIPLHKWLLATQLMVSSKKGISAHQLFRMLGFGSYRTAWFMAHRIREAMTAGDTGPLGGAGGFVEVDETYIGRKKGVDAPVGGFRHKLRVVSLVCRDTGVVRSINSETITGGEVARIVRANVAREATLMTDEARLYWAVGREFASHQRVLHAGGEYVRGEAHTNTIEGFFSIFKRGMRGVYQHCGEQHLHRYLAEFDFRYSNRAALGVNDNARSVIAVQGVVGKRLTYQQANRLAA